MLLRALPYLNWTWAFSQKRRYLQEKKSHPNDWNNLPLLVKKVDLVCFPSQTAKWGTLLKWWIQQNRHLLFLVSWELREQRTNHIIRNMLQIKQRLVWYILSAGSITFNLLGVSQFPTGWLMRSSDSILWSKHTLWFLLWNFPWFEFLRFWLLWCRIT